MASEAQIASPRENTEKSTVPGREFRVMTRLNSTRDGFTGQVTTLSDEDRPIFEELRAGLIADLAPETIMELQLAHSIAWDTWRLDHLRATEMNMYALGAQDPDTAVDCDDPRIQTAMTAALTFCKEANNFGAMSLCEQRLNRNVHKNLATLRSMQAERKRDYARERDHEVLIARFSEIKGLPYQAAAPMAANGFVFSNDEIIAAARRQRTLEEAEQAVGIRDRAAKRPVASQNPGRSKSGLKGAAAA